MGLLSREKKIERAWFGAHASVTLNVLYGPAQRNGFQYHNILFYYYYYAEFDSVNKSTPANIVGG